MDPTKMTPQQARRFYETVLGRLQMAGTNLGIAAKIARNIQESRYTMLFIFDDNRRIRREANRLKRKFARQAIREMLIALVLLRTGAGKLA